MKRPNMEFIERMFKTVERPSASDSRKMADYIYHLEKRLQTSSNSDYEKCPHYYEGSDGLHRVIIGRCNNPKNKQ